MTFIDHISDINKYLKSWAYYWPQWRFLTLYLYMKFMSNFIGQGYICDQLNKNITQKPDKQKQSEFYGDKINMRVWN